MLLPHGQSLCLDFFSLYPLPCILVVKFSLCTLQAAFLFYTVGWVLAWRARISVNCNYRWYTWLEGRDREKTQQNKRQTVICCKGRCHKVTDYVKNTVKVFSGVCVFVSAQPFFAYEIKNIYIMKCSHCISWLWFKCWGERKKIVSIVSSSRCVMYRGVHI